MRALVVVICVGLLTARAVAGVSVESQQIDENNIDKYIHEHKLPQIVTALKTLDGQQRDKFFDILIYSLEDTRVKWELVDLQTIDQLLVAFQQTAKAMDPKVLSRSPCYEPRAGIDAYCATSYHGIAYAMYAATKQKEPCWLALLRAEQRPAVFKDGIVNYYKDMSSAQDKSTCSPPPEPERCKAAWCTDDYSAGIQIRPAADLGFMIPLGHPKFGFKEDSSGSQPAVQALAGVRGRAFAASDSIGVDIILGAANAVRTNMDGSTTTALGVTWGGGINFLAGILGLRLLAVTDPSNAHTGVAISFTLDATAVKEKVSDGK